MKSQPLKISQAILANFPLFCIINFQIITIVNNGVIKEIEKIEVLQIPIIVIKIMSLLELGVINSAMMILMDLLA